MNGKQIYDQSMKRLVKEGIIKATICALIVAFALGFVAAFITFLLNVNGLWIALAVLGGVTLIGAPIFYFAMFKPSTKDMARRIDALGLDERVITMMELENDDSYVAKLQREDAQAKLATVEPSRIKFSPFKMPIVAAMVVALLASSMTTVSALCANTEAPDPNDLVDVVPLEQIAYIHVFYVVEEGGHIVGEAEQLVEPGDPANKVSAEADEGWGFEKWSDEITDVERTEDGVIVELTLTAVFQRMEFGGQQQGQGQPGEGEGNEEGDKGDGNGEESQEGPPSDSASGNRDEGKDQVIDGNTFYKDVIEAYYAEAMATLAAGGEVDPVIRALIEAYYGALGQ